MNKKIFIINFLVLLFTYLSACSNETDKLPIFLYEIGGKKGFVNTKFEIVRKAEYYTSEYDFADYSKYASISSKLIDAQIEYDRGKAYYLILFDGTERTTSKNSWFLQSNLEMIIMV